MLFLEGKVQELTDKNVLLNQSIKDGSQLPSLLMRSQENSRKEILGLKQQVSEKDQNMAKLIR